MKTYAHAYEEAVEELWRPATVRKLARQLAVIAADALLGQEGPVRTPGSERLAASIVSKATGKPDLAALVRTIQQASLHLCHPRYVAQQVAAPIPAAALVESVVAAMNQSLAVWEMSPIATAGLQLITALSKGPQGERAGVLILAAPSAGTHLSEKAWVHRSRERSRRAV